MKMVAVSKLRHAQRQVESNRAYAQKILQMTQAINLALRNEASDIPPLIRGSGRQDVHLLLIMTTDRGLCGGLNGSLIRKVRSHIETLKREGKTIKIWCLGRKGKEMLKSSYASLIGETYQDIPRHPSPYATIQDIVQTLITSFDQGEFDSATLYYNEFQSILVQNPREQQLIPATLPETSDSSLLFDFEPEAEEILRLLIPLSLKSQMYRCLLESVASEQGARITAMDNATRNAGEMLAALTLSYNRLRQSYITKELIEIISGAEAIS